VSEKTLCGACGAECPLYLCRDCETDLGDMLTSLIDGGPLLRQISDDVVREEESSPGLLERLAEAAVGQVRLGCPGRYSRRDPPGLNGGDHPLALLPENPDKELGLDAARALRPARLRRQFLAMGKANERASLLQAEIEHTLSVWAGGLAKTHGTVINPMNPFRTTTRDYAAWLVVNTNLIAKDEDAGCFYKDIKTYLRKIEAAINRPEAQQFVGQCVALITDHAKCKDKDGKPTCSRHEHECAQQLLAKRGSIQVECPACKTTHSVEKLLTTWLNRAEHERFTVKQLTEVVFPRLPKEERVSRTTLYDWLSQGKLKATGFLRKDGFIGVTRRDDSDELMVRLSDVRRMKAAQAEKKVS